MKRVIINSKAYELWRDIENAFLTQHYESNYIFCKHIIKRQRMKDGSVQPRDYIYYYRVATREKPDRLFRKREGMNNQYTKHEYLGSFRNFSRNYISLMDHLMNKGIVKEMEKGVFEINERIINELNDKAPKSFNSVEVQKLIKKLEA